MPVKNNRNIALIHECIWHKEQPFVGASESGNIKKWLNGGLSPFRVVVAGDNHKGFIVQTDTELIINCGTMMRRNIGEIDYAPLVTILDINDNTVKYEQVFLDTSNDVIEVPKNVNTDKMTSEELNEFIGLLKNQDNGKELSFENALKKVIAEKKTRNEVINLIYKYKGCIE